MKKIIFAMLPLAAMVVASCSEDIEMQDTLAAEGRTYSELKASFGTQDTRIAIGSDDKLVWSSGDKLFVYDAAYSVSATYTMKNETDAGQPTATFTGTFDSEKTPAQALFCEGDAAPTVTEGKATITIPASTAYATDKHPIPMKGAIIDGNISLKALVGYLKIKFDKVPKEATQLVVASTTMPLSGSFTVDLQADEAVLTAVESGTNKSFTYTFSNTQDQTDVVFYVPVPVGTYPNIGISLMKDATTQLCSIVYMNKTVERNKLYAINLTYVENQISLTSTATTEQQLGQEIAQAMTLAPDGSTVVIDVENTIDADNGVVSVPYFSSKKVDLKLNFKTAPTTTDTAPLDFHDFLDNADKSNDDAQATSNHTVDITMPGGSTVATMNVLMPYSTVNLKSSDATTVTYASLTSKTAAATLVVEKDVKVDGLTAQGGKLKVDGGNVALSSGTIPAVEVAPGSTLNIASGVTVTELIISAAAEGETASAATITNRGTITNIDDQSGCTKVDNQEGATISKPVQGKKSGEEAYYATIAAAREAGCTEITLNADIKETLTEITSDLTLNLNGKTLSLKGNHDYDNYQTLQRYCPAIYLNGNSDFNMTINGGASAEEPTSLGKIVLAEPWFSGIYSTKGSLTLNYADLEFSDDNGFTASNAGFVFWYDAGNLTINGGEIAFGSKPQYGIDFEGPEMNIKGTKFTSTCTQGNTVLYFEVGTANIEDVTIQSKALGGVYASGSKTYKKTSTGYVKNCNITVDAINQSGYSWMSSALAASHGSTLNVEGSTCIHKGEKAAAYVFSSGGTINLKSGTYEGTESCLRVDRSTSDLSAATVGSWIYYSSDCTLKGNNSTNISEGFTGGIEQKSF